MKFRLVTISVAALLLILLTAHFSLPSAIATKRLLYVAEPGIRNYVEYGGVGILVYDVDAGFKFVKRIPTWSYAVGQAPENIKGIVANAKTGRLYLSTPKRIAAFDLVTEKMVWDKTYDGGCDRMALTPDGRTLFVPSFEGPHWLAVDAMTGEVVKKFETNSGAHNTICSLDGRFAYLAGLKSPLLPVVDVKAMEIARRVGPFGNVIRPFTINGAQSLVYVNVNDLLGFEIGDLKTGKLLHRVEVAGYSKGPVKRHGCPSHGVGLTPDEREVWLCDGFNESLHIFDNTVMPPRQIKSLKVRDQPGWISFSLDGSRAYPSTGEVFDVKTKQTLALLTDEEGRKVMSEKLLEIEFVGGKPVRAGDQFGLGRK